MIIGTDRAQPVGGSDGANGFVEELGLPQADLRKTLWGDATGLFKADRSG